MSKNIDRSQEAQEGSPLVQQTVEGSARHQAALAVVVALLAITVIDTSFIDTLRPSLTQSAASYERTRRDVGFAGVPMEAVAEAIDRRLPPEEAVSLAPSVINNALLFQRFCEGLYPRRISTTALHQVTVDPAAAGILLAGTAKLLGPAVEAKLVPRFYSVSRDLGRALLLTLSVLGWGLLVMAGLRKLRSAQGSLHGIAASLFLPVALLVGILCIAIICSLATWMNLRVPWNVLASAGLVAAVGVFATWISHLVRMGALKSRARALGGAALSVLLRPEVLLGFALLVLAIYLVDGSPLVLWDTRSIWFFRAKQMFFSGRFLSQDANDYVWAHPGYPLLFPSILAFFSALGGWDERRAAIGIAVLLASLSSLIFILARRALGRWAGALFAVIPGLYLYSFLIGGYADGPVTLCLLVAVLGFWDEDSEKVGWLAAFSAALIKREGLVLALVLCLVHSVLGKPCRQRRWSRRALAFLGFLPPILHGVWVKHLGILDPYAKAKLPEKSEEIWSRFSVLWDVLRNQGWIRTPAKIGFIGLLLSLAFTRNWRREPSGTASALTGVVAVGFTYFVFMVTPFDLRWHVATAYQRVISHSYFLLALGGVLLSSAQPRNQGLAIRPGLKDCDEGQGRTGQPCVDAAKDRREGVEREDLS